MEDDGRSGVDATGRGKQETRCADQPSFGASRPSEPHVRRRGPPCLASRLPNLLAPSRLLSVLPRAASPIPSRDTEALLDAATQVRPPPSVLLILTTDARPISPTAPHPHLTSLAPSHLPGRRNWQELGMESYVVNQMYKQSGGDKESELPSVIHLLLFSAVGWSGSPSGIATARERARVKRTSPRPPPSMSLMRAQGADWRRRMVASLSPQANRVDMGVDGSLDGNFLISVGVLDVGDGPASVHRGQQIVVLMNKQSQLLFIDIYGLQHTRC